MDDDMSERAHDEGATPQDKWALQESSDDEAGTPSEKSPSSSSAIARLDVAIVPHSQPPQRKAQRQRPPVPSVGAGSEVTMKHCGVCQKAPAEVKWFMTTETYTLQGVMTIPVGTLCFTCGTAGEAYPQQYAGEAGRKALVERYHSPDRRFKVSFDMVRKLAESIQSRLCAHQEVSKSRSCGMNIIKVEAGLVTLENFKEYVMVDATESKSKLITIVEAPLPSNETQFIKGVVMDLKDIPAKVPILYLRAVVLAGPDIEPHLVERLGHFAKGTA